MPRAASPPLTLASSSTSTLHQCPAVQFPFKPKRFQFLKPCSSLKQTKKQQLSKAPDNAPQSLRRFFNFNPTAQNGQIKDADADGGADDTTLKGSILAGLLLVGVVGGFGTVGYIYKDQINAFLTQFSGFIEGFSSLIIGSDMPLIFDF